MGGFAPLHLAPLTPGQSMWPSWHLDPGKFLGF